VWSTYARRGAIACSSYGGAGHGLLRLRAVVCLAGTRLWLACVFPLRLLQPCDADEFTAVQLAVAVMLCLGYTLLKWVPGSSPCLVSSLLVVISALLFLKVESATCDTYLFHLYGLTIFLLLAAGWTLRNYFQALRNSFLWSFLCMWWMAELLSLVQPTSASWT
jgi:hypothetical protein